MHYLHVKPLSERELEVLQWLAAGASDREISQGLYITQSTVSRHVHNILGKLNVGSRTQGALRAIKLGLAPHPKLLPPIPRNRARDDAQVAESGHRPPALNRG